MIKQGRVYYLFSTGVEHGLNGGTIQLRRSTNLVTWELMGTVFDAVPEWVTKAVGPIPNLWAPDISFFNDKYHLYYAGSHFGTNNSVIGLATNTTLDSNNPAYRWVDEGKVVSSLPASDNYNAIDPNVSFDAAGVPWLAFGSFWSGIKLRRLDPATGKPTDADPKLYPIASRGGGAIEAPAIVFHDGYYYLFVSWDRCCAGVNSTYRIMVGRATAITGPYLDSTGKELNAGGGDQLLAGYDHVRGPGGQSVFVDGKAFWLVHHYYDALQNGAVKVHVRQLTWTKDHWPVAGAPYQGKQSYFSFVP
ncbi:MAG: arabinan endo-1,5-alpha-L-arabinosidase AbnA [Herpetosiphon sp.]